MKIKVNVKEDKIDEALSDLFAMVYQQRKGIHLQNGLWNKCKGKSLARKEITQWKQ